MKDSFAESMTVVAGIVAPYAVLKCAQAHETVGAVFFLFWALFAWGGILPRFWRGKSVDRLR